MPPAGRPICCGWSGAAAVVCAVKSDIGPALRHTVPEDGAWVACAGVILVVLRRTLSCVAVAAPQRPLGRGDVLSPVVAVALRRTDLSGLDTDPLVEHVDSLTA